MDSTPTPTETTESPDLNLAKSIVEELFFDLKPQIERALKLPKHVDESVFFSGHIFVQPKLYLQVKLVSGEPALSDQVMKSDIFGGVHRLPEKSFHEGVANFRRIGNTPIFGLSQPTKDGLEAVLGYIKNCGFQAVKWVNLREEPIIMVNSRPFSPRDPFTLNVNLDHLIGIEGFHLESMEERLKADILAKVRYNNSFQYYKQDIDMENVLTTEEVNPSSFHTPRELFGLYKYSNNLEYYRIPITDECAPEEKDFDEMVEVLKFVPLTKTACVFNCQMGRGRTTTGLVCAYLILGHLNQKANGVILAPVAIPPPQKKLNTTPNFLNGEYYVINSLISYLEDGENVKAQVDLAIDNCAHIQNLRTSIYECKEKSELTTMSDGKAPDEWKVRGKLYLERYWWLILFNSYLVMEVSNDFKKPFTEFMKARWGLKRLLRHLELK